MKDGLASFLRAASAFTALVAALGVQTWRRYFIRDHHATGDDSAALIVSPLVIVDSPPGGLVKDAPPAPSHELLVVETLHDVEEVSSPPTESYTATQDIVVELELPGASVVDLIEDAATSAPCPTTVGVIETLVDSSATDAVPAPPPELQSVVDEDADKAAEPIDRLEQAHRLDEAAVNNADKPREVASEPMPRPPTKPSAPPSQRPAQPAVHRDRRGRRRNPTPTTIPPPIAENRASRPPAEARLRLFLHPIRRTVGLSVVLMRPDSFPESVTLHMNGQTLIESYSDQRYDDLNLPWTRELLEGELRLTSVEGFQWLRSARQVHIFAGDPSEPGLVSVGAVRLGATHTLICRTDDAAAVCAAALSAGSPMPISHEHWRGIPDNWVVLSGYAPVHAATLPLVSGLRPLDPGTGTEIGFEDGLAIRPKIFAEGYPPRITINPAPVDAVVTIGGQPASLAAGGGWQAPDWNTPGHHVVDVVPGPSVTYEIAADPWKGAGWEFWDAHSGRFGDHAVGSWARAEICGANIKGPAGQAVLALETQPILIALGARSSAVPLQQRIDAPVSVGFMPELPAFLLSATGQRRNQGRVIWLGFMLPEPGSKRADTDWASVIRMASSRRLPLQGADSIGEDVWRRAKARARRLTKARR